MGGGRAIGAPPAPALVRAAALRRTQGQYPSVACRLPPDALSRVPRADHAAGAPSGGEARTAGGALLRDPAALGRSSRLGGILFVLGRPGSPSPPAVSLVTGSSSLPVRRGLPGSLTLASVSDFLQCPHCTKYSPFLSPCSLHLFHLFVLFLPPAVSFPALLSIPILSDGSCFSLPIPSALFYLPPHFLPTSVSLVCLSVRVSLPRSLSLSSAINFPDWLPDSRAADEPYSFLGLTLSTCPG